VRSDRILLVGALTALLAFLSIRSWAQQSWTQTNGPYGGDIREVVFSNNGNAYALSYAGRIYRSTDDGSNWRELSTDIGGLFATYVAVDSSGNVYAAASDVQSVSSFASIYESTNGDRWTFLGSVPTQKQILTLGINALGHLYAGTGGTTIFPAEGPFRSTDGGMTWTGLALGSAPDALLDIAFDSSGKVFLLGGRGLYRSSNNGQSWTNVWSGNANTLVVTYSGHLFMGSSSASNAGVYRSTSEGGTWSQVNSGLSTLNVRCLAVNHANALFAGTDHGMFASSDDGANWNTITTLKVTGAIQSIAINLYGDLLAGIPTSGQIGGIYRSTDAGSTWYDANSGLANIGVVSLAVDGSGKAYAAGQYYGLWGSTDKGNSWKELGLSNENISAVAVDQSGQVFAGSTQTIFHSTDAGTTWRASVLGDTIAPTVRVITFNTSNHVFAGTFKGVFRSIDNGETWQRTNNGLTIPTVRTLAVLSNGDILAGTVNGLFRSTNEGELWAPSGLSTENVGSLVLSPNSHLFAATLYDGVFRSFDNGVSWSAVNSGLPRPSPSGPNIPIEHLAINSQGTVFASVGSIGLYYSTNDAATWMPMNNGLTDPTVWALCVEPSGYLFAGTAGSGVYRTLQSTVTDVVHTPSTPETFILEQNFPNPFNPSTTISYQLTANSKVNLKIYNMLGQEVASLVDGDRLTGYHQEVWDATQCSSGVYLYQLIASDNYGTKQVARKRMLLLK
jgi:photosystem II stability/assembly factor-like uncharacterized protein